jgi:hypothetical protein
VGKLKSSAKSPPIEIGKDDRRVVQELDNNKRVATGDVQEAISGEELEDLLPEAASSKKPKAGVYKEKAYTSSGASSVGGAEEGVVVARVGAQKTSGGVPEDFADRRALLLRWASGEAPELAADAVANLVKSVVGPPPFTPTLTQGSGAGEFSWDLTRHWKSRQAAVMKHHMDDPDALRTIATVDSSRGVLKVVHARLTELGVEL